MVQTPALIADDPPVSEARLRLVEPKRAEPVYRMLAASALMALSACTLAAAIILGPFWETNDPRPVKFAAHPAAAFSTGYRSPARS